MGTESFSGVKRPGRGVDHPPPSIAEVKERVELYLYSPSGPSWACSNVNFTFTFSRSKKVNSLPSLYTTPQFISVLTTFPVLTLRLPD